MEKITLYQPRHNFAPPKGKGHIYLPSSLSTVAGRIIAAGGDVEMQDGNLHDPEFKTPIIGVNILGAPYIPIAIKLKQQIAVALGDEAKLILGGQVISGLSDEQFNRLFGKNTYNGNNDGTLKKLLGMELRAMPAPEETSLVPAYEKISDADFKEYMEHEFSFYLAQGCKFGCEFCAANRTFRDPMNGTITPISERYRNPEIVEKELKYMVERAKKLGIHMFDIYLTNLDTFQTPHKLKEFAKIVLGIKKEHPGFMFRLRGLCTTKEFMKTYREDKETIELMIEAGLWSLGFGVDGTSKEVWRSIKKGHNNLDESIEAIRLTRHEFGITPEVFMVVGHDSDTQETLMNDVEFILDMADEFGAAPRPYIAKNIVPGNTGWKDPVNQEFVEMLIQHPEYFEALDFAALPSAITHPNSSMHQPIKDAFQMLLNVPGNTTKPVYPSSIEINARTRKIYERLNGGKFDR